MKNKVLLSAKVMIIFAAIILFVPQLTFAAKSPTPRLTEIQGMWTPNIRAHFQIHPVTAGQIIKVKYALKTSKFNDVKYKIPAKAKKSGQVKAATSATGSAIDLFNLPANSNKFLYHIRVRIAVPGKNWSSWSNEFSF